MEGHFKILITLLSHWFDKENQLMKKIDWKGKLIDEDIITCEDIKKNMRNSSYFILRLSVLYMGPLFFAIALSIGNTVNILELYQTTETLENKEKQASIA